MRLAFKTRQIPVRRNQKVVSWPAIELAFHRPTGGAIRKDVFIDTGSVDSLFPLSLASQIGIDDVTTLERVSIETGSGHPINGYLTVAEMSIRSPHNSRRGWDWSGEIVLANVSTSLFGVLGHFGFLEFFQFELDVANKQFSLEENIHFSGEVLTFP
jgi:hypothetical protein